MANLTGFPVHQLYSGKKIPKFLGIITNIPVRIFACRNAPTKSNCFTYTLKQLAWAKNIFNDLNEAVGDHLSSVMLCTEDPHTPQVKFSVYLIAIALYLNLEYLHDRCTCFTRR